MYSYFLKLYIFFTCCVYFFGMKNKTEATL